MAKTRPTARTLDLLRKQGAVAQVVERWQMIPGHPGGGVRQDLFGCLRFDTELSQLIDCLD